MPKSFLLKRRSLNGANAQNEAKPPPLEKVEVKRPFDRVEKEMDYRNFYEEATTSLLAVPPYSSVYSVSSPDLNEEILKYTVQRPVNTLIPFCGIISSDQMNNYMANDIETSRADFSSFQGEISLSQNLEWSKSISQPVPLDAALEDEIAFPPPSKIIPGRVSIAPARQPFQCHQCGKVFKTKYTLAIHLKMPSHTIARPFVCNVCGKGFRLSSTLCRHKIIHTSEKPHKCQICQKAFNRSSTLKTHIRTHSVEKEFICDRCGKGFHQKGNLRNHVLIHTGEKPYKCTLCRKAFNKLSNLKFHMHVHTDNSPYRCRVCKVSFSRRCDLKTHTENTHSVHTGPPKTET